jgi:threonine dehydrogenase-like Zn-dependent dehydrogenase
VITGGICGSDLHIFTNNTGPSPTLVGFAALPFILGHEIAGRVVEAGPECDVAPGTRVAVEPAITCEARGIDPPCRHCARGDMSACLNLDSQVVTPGMALGFTAGLGGGWAEQVLAHRSMLFPIPDAVPDRGASLHEPVSITVHGLLRQRPEPGAPVAIVGAGIIGLAATAATRVLFPDSEVTVLARYAHQAAAATAAGAHHVVLCDPEGGYYETLAQISGGRVIGRRNHAMIVGGFPYVVEAVGVTSAVNDALRLADNRGTVLLLGAAGTAEYDLTPVWWKELALVGAINHSFDPGPTGGGRRSSIDRALDVLALGALPDDVVVTHEFALDQYREAVATAIDRQAGAIKVVFRPER